MRIAIDYSAAVNQRAGSGAWCATRFSPWPTSITTTTTGWSTPARIEGSVPQFPRARNFSRHEIRLRERWLTILWHRAKLPLPADWLSGPVDLYHSPDFVLPPLRNARGILTVHDLAFLMRPDCADERLRAYLEEVVPRSVQRADFIIADSENTRNDLVVLLGVQPASHRRGAGRRRGALRAGDRRRNSCSMPAQPDRRRRRAVRAGHRRHRAAQEPESADGCVSAR